MGGAQALEAEAERLMAQTGALGAEKGEREAEAAELRARLRSAEEKVHPPSSHRRFSSLGIRSA